MISGFNLFMLSRNNNETECYDIVHLNLMKEIFNLFKSFYNDNKERYDFVISIPKGSFHEYYMYYFYDYENKDKEKIKKLKMEAKEEFLKYYPFKEFFFNISIINVKGSFYLVVNNNVLINYSLGPYGSYPILDDYSDPDDHFTKYLKLIYNEGVKTIERIKNDTYKSFLESRPAEFKYGYISKKKLKEIVPNLKFNYEEKIDEDDRKDFLFENFNVNYIKDITLHDYLYACMLCYKGCGYKVDGMTLIDLYKKYAEGRDDDLLSIDIYSHEELIKWMNNEYRSGHGHPFEIDRGGISLGVHLYIYEDENGYYYKLHDLSSVGKDYSSLIKMYNELRKNHIKVELDTKDEITNLLNDNYNIGFVPIYYNYLYNYSRAFDDKLNVLYTFTLDEDCMIDYRNEIIENITIIK